MDLRHQDGTVHPMTEPSENPTSRSLRDRALTAAVPVLLAVVALTQITAAHAADLTPWKGGGFGMFTNIDRIIERSLHITVYTSSGEAVVLTDTETAAQIAEALAQRSKRVRAMPDTKTLRELGYAVLNTGVYLASPPGAPPRYTLEPTGTEPLEIESVRLQVRGIRFNPESSTAELRPIKELLVERSELVGGVDRDGK
jgi:hypothetical protein